MPVPLDSSERVLADFGSHVFTENGLFLNITEADVQALALPTYGPPPEVANG